MKFAVFSFEYFHKFEISQHCEFKKPVTMKTSFKVLFTFIIAIGLLTACYKEKDTIAEVKVVTVSGSPVAGAEVRMYGQSTKPDDDAGEIRIDVAKFTTEKGIAVFDFSSYYVQGQSGFAILDVDITKVYPDSTVFMQAIMKVVEEETNRKTFILIGQ